MLTRAARNAYSWWWASHIRTKQSKWLEHNLQDMEEKAEYILKIITEDGDSFRVRAEQYYRKRPEIVNFVEDTFREYRALAERYDHLSKDLQSANRTIAMFFPERVQMSIDDEDYEEFTLSLEENDQNKMHSSSPVPTPLPLPEAPAFPKVENVVQAMMKKKSKMPTKMMSKRGLIKMGIDENASGVSKSSGLSKDEALDEIDRLQKEILGLQTEKEFVKSSYENALSKYWEIENTVTEIHARICSLQDEFGVGAVIEETDAQTLMSSSALKTCEVTLEKLKNKQQRFKKEATTEHKRVDEIRKKFEALIASNKDSNPDSKNSEQTTEHVKDKKAKIEEKQHTENSSEQEGNLESETVCKSDHQKEDESIEDKKARIKEEILGKNGPITISEVAEKIEQLVDKVFNLETEVTSQAALVMRLRLENDELHEQLQRLEEEKETLEDDSNNMKLKIKRLEEELKRVQNLDQKVKGQNVRLETSFDEASVDLDYLSKELLTAKPDEKIQEDDQINYPEEKETGSQKGHDHDLDEKDMEEKWREIGGEDDHWKGSAENPNENDGNPNEKDEDDDDLKLQDKAMEGRKDREWTKMVVKKEQDVDHIDEEEDQPDWNLIFSYGVEDREKMLLEEYTTTLRNYKQVKKKLNEIEKRSRANTFRSAVQMKMLRTANHSKDAQIKALFEKLKLLERNMDKTNQQKKSPDSVDEGIETRNGRERTVDLEEIKGPDSIDDQETESRKGFDEIELKKASDSVDEEGLERRKGLDESVEYFEPKEPPYEDLVDEGIESRKGIDESAEFFEAPDDDSVDEGIEKRKGIDESVEFFEAADDSIDERIERRKELEEFTSFKDFDPIEVEGTPKRTELDHQTTTNFKGHQDSGKQRSRKEVDDDADEPHEVSDIEEEIRKEIEELRKENLELWLRFSTTYHQINRFQDSFHDLLQDIKEVKEKKPEHGSGKQRHHHQHHSRSSFTSDIRPLYRHLLEMQTELTLWLESSEILEDDLQHRLASLSDIQDELLNLTNDVSKAEKIHDYETAKFQGEVSNMKQENIKILEELQAAAERVKKLLVDMEKTLAMLDDELGSKKKTSHSSKIPLKSFLFGVKLRKRKSSLFNCMSPSLKRRYSKLQGEAPAPAPAPTTETAPPR